jgi:hypothetical protein
MESESEIFKYQKRRKIGEIITMVLIITFMVFILDSEGGEITKILLTILMTGFLVFMISYTYVLNENIELNSESLNINKKIGKSTKIKLDKIRRVTIREEESSVEITHVAMTVFGINENQRIIVSDLDNQNRIMNLIEEKGKKYGFNVIHQDLNGKIIKRI